MKNFIALMAHIFINHFVTYIPFLGLRLFIFRTLFKIKIEKGANIGWGTKFLWPWKLTIGERTIIASGCILDARGGLTIGKDVVISWNSSIFTAYHDPDDDDFSQLRSPVVIQDHVWVASKAIVLPGVTIEKGAVVGAGSVVTKNVETGNIVAGNPACIIRKRKSKTNYSLQDSNFWDLAF